MSTLGKWLDSRSIENMLKRGVNFFNRHAVSLMVIAVGTGAFAFDMARDTDVAVYFLALMIVFSIRGLHWEEMYWQQAKKLQAQIDKKK